MFLQLGNWLVINFHCAFRESKEMNFIPITAIILAAGEGKRVGQPKWQLKVHDGESFLSTIVKKLNLAGIDKIVCVVRKNSIPVDSRITCVVNPNPDLGMFSSIHCGVHAAKQYQSAGFIIFPVDHPYVEVETLKQLIEVYEKHPDQIICPIINNKQGHPIIIPSFVAEKIIFEDYPGGLKKFLLNNGFNFCDAAVLDQNVLRNVNYLSN